MAEWVLNGTRTEQRFGWSRAGDEWVYGWSSRQWDEAHTLGVDEARNLTASVALGRPDSTDMHNLTLDWVEVETVQVGAGDPLLDRDVRRRMRMVPLRGWTQGGGGVKNTPVCLT